MKSRRTRRSDFPLPDRSRSKPFSRRAERTARYSAEERGRRAVRGFLKKSTAPRRGMPGAHSAVSPGPRWPGFNKNKSPFSPFSARFTALLAGMLKPSSPHLHTDICSSVRFPNTSPPARALLEEGERNGEQTQRRAFY